MHRYFKIYAESLEGEVGDCFVEVDSHNLIIRQVLAFGDELFWATPDTHADERHMFTDQPELDDENDPLTPISAIEFIELWEKATTNAS